MYKILIFSFIIFSTYFVSTIGQAQYPTPTPSAQQCINTLNSTNLKILSKCQNASMTKWNPDKRNETEPSARDMCCSIFNEIDCVISGAKSNCKSANVAAMLTHQQNLIGYWNNTMCITIPYHSGKCGE
jgi:hypothetical protein